MNKDDLSLIISLAAFISAVLSPVVVQLITYFFQSRKDKKEYVEKHKHEVIEKYLKEIGKYIYSEGSSSEVDLGCSHAEIYMYIPTSYWHYIDDLHSCIRKLAVFRPVCFSEQENKTRAELLDCAKDLYLELCKEFSGFARDKKIKHNAKQRKRRNT